MLFRFALLFALASLAFAQGKWVVVSWDDLKEGDFVQRRGTDIMYQVKLKAAKEVTLTIAGGELRLPRDEYENGNYLVLVTSMSLTDPGSSDTVRDPLLRCENVPFGPITIDKLVTNCWVVIDGDTGIVHRRLSSGSIEFRPGGDFGVEIRTPPFKQLVHLPKQNPILTHQVVVEKPVTRDPEYFVDFKANQTVIRIPVDAPPVGFIDEARTIKVPIQVEAIIMSPEDEQAFLATDPGGTPPTYYREERDGEVIFTQRSTISRTARLIVPPLVASDSAYVFEIVEKKSRAKLKLDELASEKSRRLPLGSPEAVPAILEILKRPDLSDRKKSDVLAYNNDPRLLPYAALYLASADEVSAEAAMRCFLLNREPSIRFLRQAFESKPIAIEMFDDKGVLRQVQVSDEGLFCRRALEILRRLEDTSLESLVFSFLGSPDAEVVAAATRYFSDVRRHMPFLVEQWSLTRDKKPWIESLLATEATQASRFVAKKAEELGADPAQIHEALQGAAPLKDCLTLYSDQWQKIFHSTLFAFEARWKAPLILKYKLDKLHEDQMKLRRQLADGVLLQLNASDSDDRLDKVRKLEYAWVLDRNLPWVGPRLGQHTIDVAEEMLSGVVVRAEPSPYARIVQYMEVGETVSPGFEESPRGMWLPVQTANGTRGWIHRSVISTGYKVVEPSRLPVDIKRQLTLGFTYDRGQLTRALDIMGAVALREGERLEAEGEWSECFRAYALAWKSGKSGFPLYVFAMSQSGVLVTGLVLALVLSGGLFFLQLRSQRRHGTRITLAAPASRSTSGKEALSKS